MGDRKRLTPKSKAKAPTNSVPPNEPPSEPPEDLPKGFPYRFTWQEPQNNKYVLREIVGQGRKGYCWTLAFNRMICAHLYYYNKVSTLVHSSARHLYAHIDEKFSKTGYLKSLEGVKKFLVQEGLVREEDCKCIAEKDPKFDSTYACDKVKDKKVLKIHKLVIVEGKDVDETELIRLVRNLGVVAIEIEVCKNYFNQEVPEVYYGPSENIRRDNHIVLLTGYSTVDKVSFLEFQNWWGLKWGFNGFGRLARKICLPRGKSSLVKSYMYPELLEENMEE